MDNKSNPPPNSGILSTDQNKIDANIKRVGSYIDAHFKRHQSEGAPMFSRVEFSITGLCNRRCGFCPRVDPKVYPNKNEHLDLNLFETIMKDLSKLGYDGSISFAGFGEPLLHPQIVEMIRIARLELPKAIIEIISNGDFVKPDSARDLYDAGLTNLVISMYDGEHQIAHFTKIREAIGMDESRFLIRNRYKPPEEHYGLTISNRAGMVDLSHLGIENPTLPLKLPCYYPHYRLMIDHKGDVLLCCHDWAKEKVVGNLFDTGIYEIWMSDELHDIRKRLARGDRTFAPCDKCNVRGTLMGGSHAKGWAEYYGQKQG